MIQSRCSRGILKGNGIRVKKFLGIQACEKCHISYFCEHNTCPDFKSEQLMMYVVMKPVL